MNSPFPKSKAQMNGEKYALQAVQQAEEKKRQRTAQRERKERRPVWGTQEWAETRGDDLGLSPDC